MSPDHKPGYGRIHDAAQIEEIEEPSKRVKMSIEALHGEILFHDIDKEKPYVQVGCGLNWPRFEIRAEEECDFGVCLVYGARKPQCYQPFTEFLGYL